MIAQSISLLRWILVLLFLSCTTFERGPLIEVVDKKTGKSVEISLSPKGRDAEANCQIAFHSIRSQLMKASSFLSEAQKNSSNWYKQLNQAKPSVCGVPESRAEFMKLLSSLLEGHSGRIGVMLPLSATNEQAYATIVNELKKTLSKFGVKDSDDRIIVRRYSKDSEDVDRAAAEMVFIDRVSSIVVVSSQHVLKIRPITENARVPMFVLNTRSEVHGTKHGFRIFPSASLAAKKLLDVYKQNQISQVLVLSPENEDSDLLIELKRLSGKLVNFSLFSFDRTSSEDISIKSKLVAERIKKSSSRVQGVLILDNFKTVRQIVSVFREVGSDSKIIFTGNQQWRSAALVDPPEEALEGSMFVDFIGSYKRIPTGIKAITTDSEYFTSAALASQIDFEILGYRLGSIVGEVLSRGWKRNAISSELRRLTNRWDDFFAKGEPAFSDRSESFWPVFIFRIQGDQIKVISQAG